MWVVYDSVGADTFLGSLDCLEPLGLMVSFGNASGPVPPFDLGLLAQKGSLYATRPTLATHIATQAALAETANDLMDMVRLRRVKINVTKAYRMADAEQAHRDLKAGPRRLDRAARHYAERRICPVHGGSGNED